MLLVIDIGNTNAVCGLYRGRRLAGEWRVRTSKPASKIADGIIRGAGEVEGVCVSSVVPWVDRILERRLRSHFSCGVLFANERTIGVPVVSRIEEEVGADRLVNVLAGYERYRSSLIIVDFGTATTFDVVSPRGEYAGGAIAPGVNLANRSLSDYTAKLPRVEIAKTRRAICYTTKTAMQSGVFHGYVGLVNHLVSKIKGEMKSSPKVIATGGLAKTIASATDAIDAVHPHLTLEGLRLVWERSVR
jgi:type III pantothenate kinase